MVFSLTSDGYPRIGIGALGRLLIGGRRFGSLFDDDPKQWRMYVDFNCSAGSFSDLATQLYPTDFLLLASTGISPRWFPFPSSCKSFIHTSINQEFTSDNH
ncbi:hypothetical protein Bca101_016637 [Brassica carinata]